MALSKCRQILTCGCRMEDVASSKNESSCPLRILNHKHGDTVRFPLVLFEGCLYETARSRPIFLDPDSERGGGATATKVHIMETTRNDGEIVVECQNDQCWSWPIVHGGFKALVPLNVGENIIKFRFPNEDFATELIFLLNYEPLALSRFVRVVYIKCVDGDGTFQAPPGVRNDIDAAVKRLRFNARLLQTFMAESLYQHGLGHHTFRLEEDELGNPKVHVFNSRLTMSKALELNGDQLYGHFSKELQSSSLYDPMCKLWTFMSCTRYDPPHPDQFSEQDIPKYVKGHTALGGGNLALFGTGGLHTWASSLDELVPSFCNTTLIDKMQLFDDSCRRGTFWANYATGLGASMHELGHCFDLAHTPKGIMGRGFDDMNCVFTMWKKPSACFVGQISASKTTVTTEIATEKQGPRASIKPQQPSTDQPKVTVIAVPSAAPSPQSNLDSNPDSNPDSSPDSNPDSSFWLSTNIARPGDWSHGAHWYRSSAVLLRYHKWLTSTDTSQHTAHNAMVHWSRDVRGPVGSCMASHENEASSLFDSAKWLDQNKARMGGFIIHAEEYVNCLRIVGYVTKSEENGECEEILSEPQGTLDVGKRFSFTFTDPDEHITSVDVRAGAWVDAVRFHTNKKSSAWMGGLGGNLHQLKAPPGREIRGFFGTSGTYLTSLGALLSSNAQTSAVETADEGNLIVDAPHGIRLIELHNKKHGEVERHWEFLSDEIPGTFSVPRAEVVDKACTIQVEDDHGYVFRSSSCPECYSQILG